MFDIPVPKRLPAAHKRAVENAWQHMQEAAANSEDDKARLEDMLKRCKRHMSKDQGLAAMTHAAYMGEVEAVDWFMPVPVIEAYIFGAEFVPILDNEIMLEAAKVWQPELDSAPQPVPDEDPAPEALPGMDLL